MLEKKLNILIINIHGLLRGQGLELGLDSDTGGQTKYVYEYASELGNQPEVEHVYVLTRLVEDKRYSTDYALVDEPISESATIIRARCGGRRYIKKERLWTVLDEFVDHALSTIIEKGIKIDLIHSHYGDAGYVAMELSKFMNIPFIHTGHSLGFPKRNKLRENKVPEETIQNEYKLDYRVGIENEIIKKARFIVTSTQQEIDEQYVLYDSHAEGTYEVIPPGIDLTKFYPYYYLNDASIRESDTYVQTMETREYIRTELNRFFVNINKPLILTICRPEKRKNIEGLINAYGQDKELQKMANLAIFAGIRKDINQKNQFEKKILMDMLLLMDKFDLYGKLAIPKKHDFEHEIPELYRYCAELGGVFVNSSYIEPFGLTLLESAASGLPFVSTDNGGPLEIVKNCDNGILVDVNNIEEMGQAIKTLVSDDELWKRFSTNGIHNVKNYYSWESHCRHLIKIIEEKKALETNFTEQQSFKDKLFSFSKVLITDIDNTLIGDDGELVKFLDWLNNNRNNFGFGVATGRNIDSALGVLKENNVPVPDILITSVGTEIFYYHSNEFIEDKGWPAYLSERWNSEKIKQVLEQFDFLSPQEDMRRFKVSYYIQDCNQEKVRLIHKVLKEQNLRYKLVVTENLYIDILPYRASKYKAIVHVATKWRLALDRILVSGDSGNDREMLRDMQNSVVVENHQEELKNLKNVYFSEEKYAGAILDGLKHYNFI